MYSLDTKVLHLNNVADTGRNLVSFARSEGRYWALRPLPAAPSLVSPSAWLQRGADAFTYATSTRKPDLAHIHYGPNGYYGWIKQAPYILHLHGTDLRIDWGCSGIGALTRSAILRADRVLVATPDLLEEAQTIRSDSIYVPNPLPPHLLQQTPEQKPIPGRVVFNARWDAAKGGNDLIGIANALVQQGIKVVGIDWGTHTGEARKAGVQLLPKMTPPEYQQFLGEGEVVVGQFSVGSFGISDLQTLAAGRPLVTFLNNEAESDAPVVNVGSEEVAQEVSKLLDDANQRKNLGAAGRNWVLQSRHPSSALTQLESIYTEVLR